MIVAWTISYDPKAKAWISFHDWCPELALPRPLILIISLLLKL
jgi:hypothetical protein